MTKAENKIKKNNKKLINSLNTDSFDTSTIIFQSICSKAVYEPGHVITE